MHVINDGKELNRIIFLMLIYLLGCNSVPDNNESKINVSSEAEKRVHELINKNVVASAEIYNDPSTSRGSDKIFVFLFGFLIFWVFVLRARCDMGFRFRIFSFFFGM